MKIKNLDEILFKIYVEFMDKKLVIHGYSKSVLKKSRFIKRIEEIIIKKIMIN